MAAYYDSHSVHLGSEAVLSERYYHAYSRYVRHSALDSLGSHDSTPRDQAEPGGRSGEAP